MHSSFICIMQFIWTDLWFCLQQLFIIFVICNRSLYLFQCLMFQPTNGIHINIWRVLHLWICQAESFNIIRGEQTAPVDSDHQKMSFHKCNQCSYIALNILSLTWHLSAVHKNRTSFNCKKCYFSTEMSTDLTNHIKRMHRKQSQRKRVECSLCTTLFQTCQGLKMHIKCAHQHLRQFKCSECDYATSDKSNFKAHIYCIH